MTHPKEFVTICKIEKETPASLFITSQTNSKPVRIAKKHIMKGSHNLGDPTWDKENRKREKIEVVDEGMLIIPTWIARQLSLYPPTNQEQDNVERSTRIERKRKNRQTRLQECKKGKTKKERIKARRMASKSI